jgi:hypothetical protein
MPALNWRANCFGALNQRFLDGAFVSPAVPHHRISPTSAPGGEADIERVDGGHNKTGTRPGFRIPGSGGCDCLRGFAAQLCRPMLVSKKNYCGDEEII